MNPLLALTGVGAVATWIGLLSAVISIVLSVIAILFARDVDHRSMEISSQTIRALESIQATVQRLSDDTGGLIKVAWERMLGSMATPAPRADGDLQGLLSGLLGEFRQDVTELPRARVWTRSPETSPSGCAGLPRKDSAEGGTAG